MSFAFFLGPIALMNLIGPVAQKGASQPLAWQAALDAHTVVGLRLTGKVVGGHRLGGEIVVRRANTDLWRQERLNPWKVLVADVDGDGKPEVLVGVRKKSPHDPVMENRLFVFSWNGERLLPKWLGSRLSRRFDDFTVADVAGDGKMRLFALERGDAGRHRVAEYRWLCFGFTWVGCSPEQSGLEGLESEGSTVLVFGRSGLFRVNAGGTGLTLERTRRPPAGVSRAETPDEKRLFMRRVVEHSARC